MNWQYKINEIESEPLDGLEIVRLVERRKLGKDTLVRKEDTYVWVPLGTIPELIPKKKPKKSISLAPFLEKTKLEAEIKNINSVAGKYVNVDLHDEEESPAMLGQEEVIAGSAGRDSTSDLEYGEKRVQVDAMKHAPADESHVSQEDSSASGKSVYGRLRSNFELRALIGLLMALASVNVWFHMKNMYGFQVNSISFILGIFVGFALHSIMIGNRNDGDQEHEDAQRAHFRNRRKNSKWV